MFLSTLFLLLVVQLSSQKSPNIASELSDIASRDYPWDIDGPCQVYVERLSKKIGQIVQCAANFTIPPKVCTNCFEYYIDFRQVEYETKHLDNVTSLDNSTCSDVIYRNYLLSYVNELSEFVNSRIWDASRCDDCIIIEWHFENKTSDYQYNENVKAFADKLDLWRDCITNYSDVASMLNQNNTEICINCNDLFTDLYKFYWKIYVTPNVQFCVDVETTMNDTVRLWNNVWNCSSIPDRQKEFVPVTITAGLLVLFTVFFYLSSFIQGGGEARRFVQYSRMADPRPARQHLLTSSASDANMSRDSRSSSSTNPLSARARVHGRRD